MVKFGVIGYGYWGPNVVRNLDQLDGSAVVAVCDKSPAARKRIHKSLPARESCLGNLRSSCHPLRSMRSRS